MIVLLLPVIDLVSLSFLQRADVGPKSAEAIVDDGFAHSELLRFREQDEISGCFVLKDYVVVGALSIRSVVVRAVDVFARGLQVTRGRRIRQCAADGAARIFECARGCEMKESFCAYETVLFGCRAE